MPSARLQVIARAGSGKTTTIVELMKLLPPQQRVLYVVFNKHNAEEAKKKVPANVSAMTLNAFGYKALKSAYPKVEMNQYKVLDALELVVPDERERRPLQGAISKLVSLKKANRRMRAEEIVQRYDVDAPTDPEAVDRFFEIAAAVYKRCESMNLVVDFDDQWHYPASRKFPLPEYDWCFVDEAQDLSAAQAELVGRISKRVVAVGDPRQSIYGFRGADPDAMPNMQVALGMEVLSLPICYRCPRDVVRDAQRLVPDIQWAPNAPEGLVDAIDVKDLTTVIRAGDWVLGRTTAPLVKECMKFIVQGIKATVKGRDIGDQLVKFLDKFAATDAVPTLDWLGKMSDYAVKERERLDKLNREGQLQSLNDRIECLVALSEGTHAAGDVKRKIQTVFSDQKSPGINFATAHRSKGLEADNVFLLGPMQSPKAKLEWQRTQEQNLEYVAITRAMKRLCRVKL